MAILEARLEWVEIVEPRTREHMYANLTTGECAWEPPPGVKVYACGLCIAGHTADSFSKRTDDNQWWELFDANTGRFYYYNATSQKTVWHRPHGCDIIPLAKLQTLKQNTEAPLPTSAIDVPRSPSTASSRSTQSATAPDHSVLSNCRSSNSVQLVSCQTQTTPGNSPKPRKKLQHNHYQQHHRSAEGLVGRQLSAAMQTAPNGGREPARLRAASQQSHKQHCPKHPDRSRSESRGANDVDDVTDALKEAVLKLQTEEIAAEVQKFFEQNETRISGSASAASGDQRLPDARFPVPVAEPAGAARHLPSPAPVGDRPPQGPFVRSFVTHQQSQPTAGSPILALRHSLRSTADAPQQSSTLGRGGGARRLGSFDQASTSSFRRAAGGSAYAQNLSEAKIVSTRRTQQPPPPRSPNRRDSPKSSHSVDSTPNVPRRQLNRAAGDASDADWSPALARKGRAEWPLAPSPHKTAATAALSRADDSDSAKGSGSPVWTHRSEVAMIKSLDSGIKSSDSTVERERSSLLAAERVTEKAGEASPQPKPRASVRRDAEERLARAEPRTATLAQPYEQIAAHLAFSQQHQQLILDPLMVESSDTVVDAADDGVTSIVVSSDEDDQLEMDDDEVFADDEVDFGDATPPSMSSQEDLTASLSGRVSRQNRSSCSPIYADVPDPTSGLKPPPMRLGTAALPNSSHFHPPARLPSMGARTAAPRPARRSPVAPFPDWVEQSKRRSDGSSAAALSLVCQQRSLDRPSQNYNPGDISPPGHRPQSMCVAAHPLDLLPPNTATLSRAAKSSAGCGMDCRAAAGGSHGPVSRSASSLTRAGNAPSLSLYHGDPGIESFAHENIDRHKKGLFGKRQSIQTMLSWSREPLKRPLIMTSDKTVRKEAVGLFKRVQAYMTDRKVKANLSPNQIALDICARCWARPPLRDELFVQICKQTTDNPRAESVRRGWELLAVSLTFFPPSTNLYPYLDSFMARNSDPLLDTPEVRLSHYGQHCAKLLERGAMQLQGGARRGARKPTLDLIESAKLHIFHPSMFANTLDEVMRIQHEKFPQRQLPWVLTVLSEMVLQLNGAKTEGIFRVPGDADEVAALKMRLDRGLVPTVGDPHVPASLLKLWLRELPDPLIAAPLYSHCLAAAVAPDAVCALVERLPRLHKLVLTYLIRFLQVFVRPENVAETKMDAANLAMVMAPNCLRCQSEDPQVIFDNTRKEMAFMRTLMENYDTSCIEGIL